MLAIAMASLHERGEIDLDASLSNFSPTTNFPEEINPDTVTLRALLSQSSGISNNAIEHRLAYSGQYDDAVLFRALANSLPNEEKSLGEFEYTNSNYNILAMLVQKELGKSWKDVLEQEIFDKADMDHTTAYMSKIVYEDWSYARPHTSIDANSPKRTYLEKTDATMHSAGGVYTSPSDALKWLELLTENGIVDEKEIIPANAVRATRTPHVKVDKQFGPYQRENYGLGFYTGPYINGEHDWVHHFGGFSGAASHVSYMPNEKIGVAVFSNDSGIGARFIHVTANYIYDEILGRESALVDYEKATTGLIGLREKVFEKFKDKANTRAKLEWTIEKPYTKYSGEYTNPTYGNINISGAVDRLDIEFGNLKAKAMPHPNDETIAVELVPEKWSTISFIENDDGVIESLSYQDVVYELNSTR